MAALPRKLQAQSSCAHQSEQPLPLYGYKKFELQAGPLGQELFRYHFWIDYYQDKTNGAADALSRFSQRKEDEEEKLRTENTRIFYRLQFSLTNATLSSLSTFSSLSPLHQVLICGIHTLPQLRQF